MQKNIGKTDRLIRLSLGAFLFFFAWWQSSWIVLALAIFTVYEATTSWCILYQIIGKNTCPIKDIDKKT